ncbi:hypothetical protein L249_6921, partial [Ophiocordyceps polyrhachis-furcata BCC 54312]
PLTIYATNNNKDSTNTAFRKDMRLTRDSALPLLSSNRDKDPILNPRESSSELSDPFIGSPTDPFAEVPSLILRAF